MAFLYFAEFLVQIGVVALIVTQIIIPLVKGGKMFPLCRRRDLLVDRTAAEEDIERSLERARIEMLHRKATRIKQETQECDGHTPKQGDESE